MFVYPLWFYFLPSSADMTTRLILHNIADFGKATDSDNRPEIHPTFTELFLRLTDVKRKRAVTITGRKLSSHSSVSLPNVSKEIYWLLLIT